MTLNSQQKFTVRALFVAGSGFGILVLALLGIEAHAVVAGGHSTISEMVWLAWATQPGAILIVSHTLAAPFWFLLGHFFWQSSGEYERVRKDGL